MPVSLVLREYAGEEIRYNYDEKGDLVSVVDREGNETKYYYENEERAHYLTRIEDPLGREGITEDRAHLRSQSSNERNRLYRIKWRRRMGNHL